MSKNILSSILPLVIVIILSVVLGNFGVGRIMSLRAKIAQAKQDQATLNQKLSILRNVSSTVGTGSQAASSALPAKNPALATISQIKSLAAGNGVTLSNLKSGPEVKGTTGLSEVGISFDLAGPKAGVITFLNAVGKIAPLTVVDKIKLSESAGQSQTTVSIRSFWAAFPKTIPSVAQTISDLTQDEMNTLSKIGDLTLPQFEEIPPQDTGGKPNPFAP